MALALAAKALTEARASLTSEFTKCYTNFSFNAFATAPVRVLTSSFW